MIRIPSLPVVASNGSRVMKLKNIMPACMVAIPLALASAAGLAAKDFTYDVLELPAVPSHLATTSLIYSISKFGDRHFATGHRGHILYSDDGGDSWQQAEVPVRSSILDIDFPNPELGWAVGHEGVILNSTDGGKTWAKQYDGLRYGEEGLAYYQELAAAEPDCPSWRTPTMTASSIFLISRRYPRRENFSPAVRQACFWREISVRRRVEVLRQCPGRVASSPSLMPPMAAWS